MGKWCLHAGSFIFVRIIIKVAGNQGRHKSLVRFDFGPNQTTHFGVTCPWVTKISHFWTWISLKPVGQSWSNLMCSIIGVGERLHKVLGQIDLGTLDSGERSLPFGLLVCLLLGPPGFNCWFSFAQVFQWCCSTPQGSPGVGCNMFLSSPHLCFITVFICDYLFHVMIHWWVRKPPRGLNNCMFWAMIEAEGEVGYP